MSLPHRLNQFATLVEIIARLRAPDGCPWDRKQTHISLRENLLEECYEVLEALDDNDPGKLYDELGDLLMQVILHTQIATEAGEFDLGDVVQSINTKLVHRHPHIFGSLKVKDAAEVALNWDILKQEERGKNTSILASIPRHMPALAYAQEIQRRAAQVGFVQKDTDDIIDKLAEEVRQFKLDSSQEETARKFGDLLFALANIARCLKVDLETALRQANKLFYRRLSYMEEVCHQRGVSLSELSRDEQNALWEEAKKKVEG